MSIAVAPAAATSPRRANDAQACAAVRGPATGDFSGPKADPRSNFSEEVGPFMMRLYPAALRLTRNHCDAEDLLQDTFAKAYTSYHQFTPGTSLKAWLYRILTTTFYSSCRKRKREPVHVLSDDVTQGSDASGSLGYGPQSAETEALDRLTDSTALSALRELPGHFKTVVYLADVEGYKYAEIAAMMGIPIGTVMSRIHRGRQMLRAKLHPPAANGT